MDSVLGWLLIIALAIIIWPLILMWGWSLCMPAIFGLPYLTWTQAFGLTIVGGICRNSSSFTSKK